MKAFVTGATGFLGKALCIKLKELGFQVTGLGRNPEQCKKLKQSQISVIKGDLTDKQLLLEACAHQDYIFHCGALSSPWGKYQDFYSSNVLGTKNIITASQENVVKRLIHISTPSIYFDGKPRQNIVETDILPKKPINHYAKTKLLAEREINLAHKNGLETITLRPRGIFGPGDKTILPRLISLHEHKPLPLFSQGKVLIDVTYISNVVDAIIACIDAPKEALGRQFNITNDQPMYLINLLEMLFKKLNIPLKTKSANFLIAKNLAMIIEKFYQLMLPNKEPPLTEYTLSLLANDQTLNISAAKKCLGYQPKISIEEGLEIFVKTFR